MPMPFHRLQDKLQAASEQLQRLLDGIQMGTMGPPPPPSSPAYGHKNEPETPPAKRQQHHEGPHEHVQHQQGMEEHEEGGKWQEDELELGEQLEAAHEQIHDMELMLEERDHHIRHLVSQLEEMHEFSENVMAKAKDGDKLSEMLDKELRYQRSRMGRMSHEMSSMSVHVQAQVGELQRVHKQLGQLQDANEYLLRQVKQLKHLFAEKVRENEDLLQGLEAVRDFIAALNRDMATASSENEALEVSNQQLNKEVEILRRELEEAQAKLQRLQGGCPGNHPSPAVKALQAEVKAKADLLKAALEELEVCNDSMQGMARAIALKDDSITHLKRQLQQLADELDDAHCEVENLRFALSECGLEERLQDDWVPVDEFSTLVNKQKKKGGTKEAQELARLKDDLRDKERALRETNAMVLRFEGQIAGLQTVLSTKNMQCHKMEAEARQAEAKARELQTKLQHQEATLGSALEQARQQVAGLEGKLNAQTLQCQTTERQLAHAKFQVRELLAGLGMDVGLDLARSLQYESSSPTSSSGSGSGSCWPPAPPRRGSPTFSHNPFSFSPFRPTSPFDPVPPMLNKPNPSSPPPVLPSHMATEPANAHMDLAHLSADVELQLVPLLSLPAGVQGTLDGVKGILRTMGVEQVRLAGRGPPASLAAGRVTSPGEVLRSISAERIRSSQEQGPGHGQDHEDGTTLEQGNAQHHKPGQPPGQLQGLQKEWQQQPRQQQTYEQGLRKQQQQPILPAQQQEGIGRQQEKQVQQQGTGTEQEGLHQGMRREQEKQGQQLLQKVAEDMTWGTVVVVKAREGAEWVGPGLELRTKAPVLLDGASGLQEGGSPLIKAGATGGENGAAH